MPPRLGVLLPGVFRRKQMGCGNELTASVPAEYGLFFAKWQKKSRGAELAGIGRLVNCRRLWGVNAALPTPMTQCVVWWCGREAPVDAHCSDRLQAPPGQSRFPAPANLSYLTVFFCRLFQRGL